jgi:hypothetical protein
VESPPSKPQDDGRCAGCDPFRAHDQRGLSRREESNGPTARAGPELGVELRAQHLEPAREAFARRDLVHRRAARDLGHRELVEVAVQDRRAVGLGELHHRARDALLSRAAFDDLGSAPVSLGPGDRSLACTPRGIRARAVEREPARDGAQPCAQAARGHGVLALDRDARDLLRHVVGGACVAHDRERQPAHPTQVGQELIASGSRRAAFHVCSRMETRRSA